jgi:hypothetical protein
MTLEDACAVKIAKKSVGTFSMQAGECHLSAKGIRSDNIMFMEAVYKWK